LHDLAEADRRLADLSAELEQTARLATLGTMAAGIVHEINNLLTPVLAYAQLAKANPDDPELVHKAIDKAAGGAAAACKIAEAILGFARANNSSLVADINESLDAALSCIGRDLSRDGIELVRQIPTGASARIESVSLQQTFINLIINAREAMRSAKSHERSLTISVHHAPGGRVRIRVADTGPGIPDTIMDRLFEPFVSSKSGNSDTLARIGTAGGQLCGGSGLGLTVTRHLIEKAGGTIAVESRKGRGAVFTITLNAAESGKNAA
jgi:signal transduction histidine kinase